MSSLLIMAVITLAAAFTQGASGFGFGMVSMSLLPLVLEPRSAVPFVAVFGMVTNLGLIWELKAWRSWRDALPLLGGGVLGIPLGVAFLRGAPPALFYLCLGVVILVWVVVRRSPKPDSGPARAWGSARDWSGGPWEEPSIAVGRRPSHGSGAGPGHRIARRQLFRCSSWRSPSSN